MSFFAAGCSGAGTSTQAEDRIAFSSNRDGDFEIYTMRPDGSDVRRLTRTASRDARPIWSPDGSAIAFVNSRGEGGATEDEIGVIRSDGTGRRRLTNNALADLLSGWTEGGEIVFWQCRESIADCDLRMIRPDGSDERTIFKTRDAVLSSLGPIDGRLYARFISRDATSLEGGHTFVIDIDSGERRRAVDQGLPSPDGGHFLIQTDRDKNGPCLFHDCTGYAPELYVDNVRLTHTTGYDTDPTWSPGGKQIAFSRIANDQGDDYELWVMNANGTCQTQITDNRAWDVSPDWSGSAETDAPLDC